MRAARPQLAPVLVEACVDTVGSAVAAQAGGAGRVELCADLVEGGTTPSLGTVAVARARLTVPLFVIIRPRGGDFLYDADDVEVMRRDVACARQCGADGVVFGALTPDGRVDVPVTEALIDAARPMRVTFHRAFDVTRDLDEALDALLAIGVDHVLTSGGASSALEGVNALAGLVGRARGRLAVLAGGGVTADNVGRIVAATGVREVHVRGAERVGSGMRHRAEVTFGKPYTPDEYSRLVTNAGRIAEVVAACARPASR